MAVVSPKHINRDGALRTRLGTQCLRSPKSQSRQYPSGPNAGYVVGRRGVVLVNRPPVSRDGWRAWGGGCKGWMPDKEYDVCIQP